MVRRRDLGKEGNYRVLGVMQERRKPVLRQMMGCRFDRRKAENALADLRMEVGIWVACTVEASREREG